MVERDHHESFVHNYDCGCPALALIPSLNGGPSKVCLRGVLLDPPFHRKQV
jgi:hypothetical protein